MTTKLGLVSLSVAVIAACALFAMKDKVRRLEGQLHQLQQAASEERMLPLMAVPGPRPRPAAPRGPRRTRAGTRRAAGGTRDRMGSVPSRGA